MWEVVLNKSLHVRSLPWVVPAEVAVVLYGYPPGIGATGTAALLNVPKSLYRQAPQRNVPTKPLEVGDHGRHALRVFGLQIDSVSLGCLYVCVEYGDFKNEKQTSNLTQ